MTARTIADTVQVLSHYHMDGHWWVEIPCGPLYDDFMVLSVALEFGGRRYGRISWNSDRGRAYYTTRQLFAVSVK